MNEDPPVNAAALCICHHWQDQHPGDKASRPCAVGGCWCKGAGFFPVARGSRHRPGPATHAMPRLVRDLAPGDGILVTYTGDGHIAPSTKLADSLIAIVDGLSWSGEGDLWHVRTDLGIIPLVRGRGSLRVVRKT